MRDPQLSERRLVQALIHADPALAGLAAQSRDEDGHLLEYIYLGEVAQRVAALSRGPTDAVSELDSILAVLESALDGDEHITNVIGVGFLEHLKASGALEFVRGRFGPKLGFWADTV